MEEQEIRIDGVVIQRAAPEPCYRLVQFGRGEAITCACSRCAAKAQTPLQALVSVKAAHA